MSGFALPVATAVAVSSVNSINNSVYCNDTDNGNNISNINNSIYIIHIIYYLLL